MPRSKTQFPSGEREVAIVPMRALLDDRLDGVAKLALVGLGAHTDVMGTCWPSVERLSLLTGLSRASVFRGLKQLEDAGWIRRTRRLHNGVTVYQVLRDATPPEVDEYVSQGDGGLTPRPGGSHRETQRSHTETQKVEQEGGTRIQQQPREKIRDRFTAPHHQAAYDAVIAGNPRGRAAVHYELQLRAEGGERPGEGAVAAAGWDRVGEALHQMNAAGRAFSAISLGTFLDGLTRTAARQAPRHSTTPSGNSFERWIAEHNQGGHPE